MLNRLCATALLFVLFVATRPAAFAEVRVLEPRLRHIRSGDTREWTEFAQIAEASTLTLTFDAVPNDAEMTLRLRQQDVKQRWTVQLNGKRLGGLEADENDQLAYFTVPPGTLKEGRNTLVVETASKSSDDVRLGDVRLYTEPVEKVLSEATISVAVVADRDEALPCRITIVDESGSLAVVGAKSDDRLAVRAGMVYTADGRATFGMPAGRYTVLASRGFEYGVASETVEVKRGEDASVGLRIHRQVPTPGLVACDTHVHTFTHSRHGDATMEERMLTIAGEGLELPIAADHNIHIDYEGTAAKLGMRKYFTPVIGNEVTTQIGHFNIWPVRKGARPPDWRVPKWETIFDNIYGTPGVRVCIMNHPRNVHSNYQPMNPKHQLAVAGVNLDGWDLRANAVELVNSAALQSDPLLVYRDWFAMLNAGRRLSPIGSSDSHEVSRKLVGQGRTYIACDDKDPSKIDVDQAVTNLLAGRAYVCMGLLPMVEVNDGRGPGELVTAGGDESVTVNVRVLGPSWTRCDRVLLFVNGGLREAVRINDPSQQAASPVKWQGRWTLPATLPGAEQDYHIVVVALGPGVDGLFWRVPKPYQPTSDTWDSYVIGSSAPVWVDADGNGKFTSAAGYADALVAEHSDDDAALMAALRASDEAVVVQVAHRMQAAGRWNVRQGQPDVTDDPIHIRSAFEQYRAAWRVSDAARAAER